MRGVREVRFLYIFHQHLLSLIFFIIATMIGVRWYLILIFMSLMFSDIEYIFICLLAIGMFSSEKRLFRSCAHFYLFVTLLDLSFGTHAV